MTKELSKSGVDIDSQVGIRAQLRALSKKLQTEEAATGDPAEGRRSRMQTTGKLLKSFVSSIVEGVQIAIKPKLPEIGKRKLSMSHMKKGRSQANH